MMKTFKEIREFNAIASIYYNKNQQTKLGYAMQKLGQGQVKKIFKEFQESRSEAYYNKVEVPSINLALTDKTTGALLESPKGAERPFLYDKEGLIKIKKIEIEFNKEAEKLMEEWDIKEYEITPFYITEVPTELTPEEVTLMKGFVIDPSYELPIKNKI